MKIGIISFAHMHAYSYINCFRKIENVTLVGIADDDQQRGEQVAKTNKIAYFKDYHDLLAQDMDAVVITSENAKHKEMTVAAAEAGKHILCEKPISTNRDDALAMIEACAKHQVKFQMAFPCRFSTPIIRAKEMIESGAVGDVLAINGTNHGKMPGGWFIEKKLSGGGAVMDHTVHVVDVMRWIMKSEVKSVYAEIDTRFHNIQIDDCGTLMMEFENGVFASLDPSWSRPPSYPTWGDVTLEVVGNKGTLFVDAFKQDIDIYSETETGHQYSFWGDNIDLQLVKYFVNCFRNKQTPDVTATDGLRALEVALAAYESARRGAAIELKTMWS